MEKEKDHGSGVCAIPFFERNNYFYSKLMTVRDFFAEQRYFNEKRWLMNRMISGWGVVCGLDVTFDPQHRALIVSPGLAIDSHGREILICEDQMVKLEMLEPPCEPRQGDEENGEQHLALCLEYHECKTEPVQLTSMACGGEERHEFNRIRDSFKLRLRHLADVHLEPTFGKLCPLSYNKEHDPDLLVHEYLCRKLKSGCSECHENGCLILAKSTLYTGPQIPENPRVLVDPCYKRKLVYNNPLLFDLINCYHGDLPHIIDFSWKAEHAQEEIKWDDFEKIVNEGFTVHFDRAMDPTTINRHSFLVAVMTQEEETGSRLLKYVPAEKIEYFDDNADPRATFFIDERWKADELKAYSKIRNHGADFEVTLYGSLILDVSGKALDGEYIAAKFPTGNGVQGGNFVSWFSVQKYRSPK